jgi:hypothetical protein
VAEVVETVGRGTLGRLETRRAICIPLGKGRQGVERTNVWEPGGSWEGEGLRAVDPVTWGLSESEDEGVVAQPSGKVVMQGRKSRKG